MAQWTFDEAHTSASFSVKHMMITTVRGEFEKVVGTLNFDPANPQASSVEATIDCATISTGQNDRDNHLRSADFFDVENFPQITFKSTNVELNDDKTGKVTGDLTIRGVTRPITLDVEYLGQMDNPMLQKPVVGFEATGKLNREDFGLTWNQALESGGVLVGKEVKLNLDVQAVLVSEPETV